VQAVFVASAAHKKATLYLTATQLFAFSQIYQRVQALGFEWLKANLR